MLALFNTVVYMSMISTLVAVVIMIVRLIIGKRLPSIVSYFLWSILLFRLIIPVSFSSEISLFNFYPIINETQSIDSIDYEVSNSTNDVNEVENTIETEYMKDNVEVSYEYLAKVWIVVSTILIMLSITAYIYTFNKFKEVIICNELEEDESIGKIIKRTKVYKFSNLSTPIVCGISNPRIIIPSHLLEKQNKIILTNVLKHEMVHIQIRDYIVKLMAIFIACIHWFNPIVWVSLILFHRDMERACDEKVIQSSKEDIRKEYSKALLSLVIKNEDKVNLTVLAFGESNTKKRIKGILRYKKSNYRVKIFSITVFIMVTSFVATDASSKIVIVNLDELKEENIENWVELDDISPNVIEAAIISQDKSFQSYNGIDIMAIFRSGVNNLNNDTKQGGSTITQQMVKNICKFDKSSVINKKRSEIYTAIKIDKIYSKNEIMEAYLNCLYYGNNIIGLKNIYTKRIS